MQKFSIFSGYILNKKTPIVTIKSPIYQYNKRKKNLPRISKT